MGIHCVLVALANALRNFFRTTSTCLVQIIDCTPLRQRRSEIKRTNTNTSMASSSVGGAGFNCLMERVLPDCPCYVLRPRHQRMTDKRGGRGKVDDDSLTVHTGAACAECRHPTCRSCRGAEVSTVGATTSLQASCLYESKVGSERFANLPPGVVAVEDAAGRSDLAVGNFTLVNHLQRVAARGSDLQHYWHLREHCGCRCRCRGCQQASRPQRHASPRDDQDDGVPRRAFRTASANLPLRRRVREEEETQSHSDHSDTEGEFDECGRGRRFVNARRYEVTTASPGDRELPQTRAAGAAAVVRPSVGGASLHKANHSSLSDHLAARSRRDTRTAVPISFGSTSKTLDADDSALELTIEDGSLERTNYNLRAPAPPPSPPSSAAVAPAVVVASAKSVANLVVATASPLTLAARLQASMHRKKLDSQPAQAPRQLVKLDVGDDDEGDDEKPRDALRCSGGAIAAKRSSATFFPFVEDVTPRFSISSSTNATTVAPIVDAAPFFTAEGADAHVASLGAATAPATTQLFCDYKLRLAPSILAKHPGAVVLCPACCLVLEGDTKLVSHHIKTAHLLRSDTRSSASSSPGGGSAPSSFTVSWYPLRTTTTGGQPSELPRPPRASADGPLWHLVAGETARLLPSYVTYASCITEADREEVRAGPVSHQQFLDFFDVVTLACRDCKAQKDNSEKVLLSLVWQHANTPAHARNARQSAATASLTP